METKKKSDGPKSGTKSLAWGFGGAVLGAIGTIAVLSQNATAIANGVQYFFPQIGPFDASITISNPTVLGGPKITTKTFDGGASEPAVELSVEFIEATTGHSQLDDCYSELVLSQTKYPSTSKPVQRPSNSTQVVDETFYVPQKQYGGQATLLRQCIRRVAPPIPVNLPGLPVLIAQQQTTYVVCVGEYSQACRGNATWLPCGSDPSVWAKKNHPAECKNVAAVTLSDVSGNKCGYATVQVTCTQ
ncbi:hypothetical protein [Mesorhizobium sp. 43Arga]